MTGPLNPLDIALIVMVLLSGIVAMYRGFTREVLSILSWVVAVGACLYAVFNYRQQAQQLADQFYAPLLVAQVGIGVVVFLVVLIIVHLITSRISDSVLDSQVGVIDRIFGLAFGVVRGFVVVLVPFMLYTKFVSDEKQRYSWVTQAHSHDLLRNAGNAIEPTLYWLVERLSTKASEQRQSLLWDNQQNPR